MRTRTTPFKTQAALPYPDPNPLERVLPAVNVDEVMGTRCRAERVESHARRHIPRHRNVVTGGPFDAAVPAGDEDLNDRLPGPRRRGSGSRVHRSYRVQLAVTRPRRGIYAGDVSGTRLCLNGANA